MTDSVDAGPAGPSQDTLLHRAIGRVTAEFLGTATGQPPYGIVTFAVRGFSEAEPQGPRRTAFERVSAEVGTGMSEILAQGLEEGRLAAILTELAEQYRLTALDTGDLDSRDAYDALADTMDASVYYNRDPNAALHRRRKQPVKA
jgi:hypothetical protein